MIAIEIRVNGKLAATCGIDGLRQLLAMVAARRPRADDAPFAYLVECMGVRPHTSSTNEVLKWAPTKIALGDEVSLKFIEVKQAEAPIDRQDVPAHPPAIN
jgi:hypothetical protein